MKRFPIAGFVVVGALASAQAAWADPTVLTRVLGGGAILFGLRPSGMGGATLAVQTPATLWRLPAPAITADLGYSTLSMRWSGGTDQAQLPLLGLGVAVPLPNRWAVALRVLAMDTNEYAQQANVFAPIGLQPYRADARDFMVLAAVSKGLSDRFSLGLALSLYGKATYDIAAADGNRRHYELLERFSRLGFFHWQVRPEIAVGGQVSFINAVQVYEGQDITQPGYVDVNGRPIERFEASSAPDARDARGDRRARHRRPVRQLPVVRGYGAMAFVRAARWRCSCASRLAR